MAVLSLGLVVAFTLAQPPSTLAAKIRRPSSTATQIATRSPSAVASDSPSDEIDTGPQAVELNLPCEGGTAYARTVAQVRLSGASCLPPNSKREIASVELLNDANGFSATVFYPTRKTFTTDYVALAEGENTIKILIAYANGEREERSHVITRSK